MLGAIIGDIAGSFREFIRKSKYPEVGLLPTTKELVDKVGIVRYGLTDDSVLTIATAFACMKMSDNEIITLLESELQQNKINNGVKYNQMLIFISGNIDEAYNFAENVDDVDRDADVYYEMSKKINFLNIKNALTDKFKPEQISRFGNNHIIYPTSFLLVC